MKEIWQAVKIYFRRLDKMLLLFSATAAAFSLVLLYSEAQAGFLEASRLKMQILAGGLGIAAMFVMTLIS